MGHEGTLTNFASLTNRMSFTKVAGLHEGGGLQAVDNCLELRLGFSP